MSPVIGAMQKNEEKTRVKGRGEAGVVVRPEKIYKECDRGVVWEAHWYAFFYKYNEVDRHVGHSRTDSLWEV